MNILEITQKFSTQQKCVKHLIQVRWQGKPKCVYCGSEQVSQHKEAKNRTDRLQCSACKKSFSVTVGTIFHDSKIPLQKWFLIMALMLNAKKGISACQVARDLSMNRPTVWSIMHRIRKAMEDDDQDGDGGFLRGIIEVDETFIGGKEENKHEFKKLHEMHHLGKQAVIGMLERGGRIKARLINNVERSTLQFMIRNNIAENSLLYTDCHNGYKNLVDYRHDSVKHSAKEYVRGEVHTNSIEGFWSLLKRGIIGQFHKVSRKYLQDYVNEFSYRYNRRNNYNLFGELLGRMVSLKRN